MDDTISRQAAIDEIKNMYEAAEKWKCEVTDEVVELRADEMIEARAESCIASLIEMKLRIEKMPSAQQWIPCSERLPEEYAQYLICYEDGECFVYWLEDADWARGVIEKEHIIAWMPLPEPYKGEES